MPDDPTLSAITPQDDDEPIDTVTIWLPFKDGETAISADLTRWNAAMRRVSEALSLPAEPRRITEDELRRAVYGEDE